MTSDSFMLQAMVLLPLIGAVLVIAAAQSGVGLDFIRRFVLVNVLVTFAVSLAMINSYDPAKKDTAGNAQLLQMVVDVPWLGTAATSDADSPITGPNIRFSLGVDGISLWLIALTALLMIPAVLVSWEAIQDRAATYYALMLLLQAGMIGVFAALDIILFYIFFEFTLIPLFFMIGLWGGYDRRWAARKFFVFTLAGSLLTFLGLLFIVLAHSWMNGSPELVFSIPRLTAEIPLLLRNPENAEFWRNVSPWIFMALFAGFAIKVPLFPFHTWLPLAHVEAPTAGSVLLAGVLLKIGSYGFLRFAMALVPGACWWALDFVGILCVIGIIYGALLALAQDDIKKLVAYSSVSHMGFCLLGLFAFNNIGITGGMLTMINHGLSTGALFALVGMLYERYHTRDIDAFGGLATRFPIMAFFFILVSFSSIGLPGLNGFTGEVTALLGMFKTRPVFGILSLSGIIFGAWYMLQLVRSLMYGKLKEPAEHGHGDKKSHSPHPAAAHSSPVPDASAQQGHGGEHSHAADNSHGSDHGHGNDHGHGGHGHATPKRVFATSHTDLNLRELAALLPLVVLIVWIGVAPQFFVSRMEPSIAKIVERLEAAKPKAP